MLEEIRAKNYLSFRDEMCLSFEATADTTAESQLVVTMPDGKRLLRFAMIYGANASGKSNVLTALVFLNNFWFDKPANIDQSTGVIPFLFDVATPNEPTEFSLCFYANGIRYRYILRLSRRQVLEEKLSYYTSVRPTMLFHRIMEDERLQLFINPAVHKISEAELQQLQMQCLPNMSFFAARGQINIDLPKIDAAREWMLNRVMDIVEPSIGMFDFAKTKMETDTALTQYLLRMLKSSDFNISSIQTERVPASLSAELVQAIRNNQELTDAIKQNVLTNLNAKFEHEVCNNRGDEKYLLEDKLESRGTCRMLGIESAIFYTHKREAILPIDELESSLHPALIEHVIYDFLLHKGQSQLLITTHYDFLLDLVNDLIRKDCVWFTEKGADGASSLYSLVEFNGLNKLSSFQTAYRRGRFGATPKIN